MQLYKVDSAALTTRFCVSWFLLPPDSGADISAAGQEVLHMLGYHFDNILPSNISPRMVNGSSMEDTNDNLAESLTIRMSCTYILE